MVPNPHTAFKPQNAVSEILSITKRKKQQQQQVAKINED